jgi:two-component sensor histidine kinase
MFVREIAGHCSTSLSEIARTRLAMRGESVCRSHYERWYWTAPSTWQSQRGSRRSRFLDIATMSAQTFAGTRLDSSWANRVSCSSKAVNIMGGRVTIAATDDVPPDALKVFGVLEVDNTSPCTFSADDINFLTGLGNTVARAVELRRAMNAMEAAFKEKGLLIREMNHRTKNNLSVVAAMLLLQARRSTESEVREQLGNAVTRINNFALVHDRLQLFTSSLAKVDAAPYFEELCGMLRSLLPAGVDLTPWPTKRAFVQYLAGQKPASGLAPVNGSMERVRVQAWLNFTTSEIHKTFGLPTDPAGCLQGHLKGEPREAIRLARQAACRQAVSDRRQIHRCRRLSFHCASLVGPREHGPRQMAEPQSLRRPCGCASQGAGSDEGGGVDPMVFAKIFRPTIASPRVQRQNRMSR